MATSAISRGNSNKSSAASWHSIGRELAKVPGVVPDEERVNCSRLTFYEVKPAEEGANVVPLARRG